MKYLIDTNALSELKKRQPHPAVVQWFADRSAEALCLSVLTLGEFCKGIEAMTPGARKTRFLYWLKNDIPTYFGGRILPVDRRIAKRWGHLCATAGRPLPIIDSLLAATALEHGLTLVTRNLSDFDLPDLRVINPWQKD